MRHEQPPLRRAWRRIADRPECRYELAKSEEWIRIFEIVEGTAVR